MALKRYLLTLSVIILISFCFPTPSTAFQLSPDGGSRVITLSSAGRDIANSVAYSPDGKWLAVARSAGVSIFDTQQFSQAHFFSTAVWARSVAFSPDGQTVAAGLFDGTLRFWRLSDKEEIRTIAAHNGWVRSIAFSSDGALLATAADDDIIRIWNVESGSEALSIAGSPGARVLVFSPDDELLAVGLQDTTVQLLNASSGSLVKTLKGHKDWVRGLAFSPDGKTLASGAFDTKVILWDVASGQIKYFLADHRASVLSVSFSPDGKSLASGSVDATVKLWNTADGRLLRTLVGHTDFVYSVAFAPDGKTVASGSSDDTLRLWDLSDPSAADFPQADTPSDCRACHHPIGMSAPPRVIQMSCESCHVNGVSMNWCPFFPRSSKAVSPITYLPPADPVGLPISSENLAVQINYPTNGETLYSSGRNFSPAFVVGRVFYTGPQNEVTVRMEIWSGGQRTAELFTQPESDGAFTFSLAINPEGAMIVAGAKAADPDCASCHEEFKSQASLPDGQVQLLITAASPNGGQASDERWFTVDTGRDLEMDVRVLDSKNGEPISGLSVRAAAILYEWRDQFAGETSDANGIARLSLEALSQAATQYTISVPPTSLNGYLYESLESVVVELAPGAAGHDPVTVFVRTSQGQISGQLTSPDRLEPFEIWAVHLPDGTSHTTLAENGNFTFADLPSGKYQLFLDPSANRRGYQAAASQVDLTKDAQAEITIEIQKTGNAWAAGRLSGQDGVSLPFGWATAASDPASPVNPLNGEYRIFGLDPLKATLIANAPGYYSQARVVDLADGPAQKIDFALVRQPETRLLPWGDGNITLPPETISEESLGIRSLATGWVWGQNQKAEALNFRVAGKQITLTRGSFALEYHPARGGWLYLFEGEALIRTRDGQEVPVRAGEMVFLSEQNLPIPVAHEGTLVVSLPRGDETLLPAKWEPSLPAQIRDRLAQIGINIAQAVTFVTYIVVLIVIAAFLIRGLYLAWRRFKIRQN